MSLCLFIVQLLHKLSQRANMFDYKYTGHLKSFDMLLSSLFVRGQVFALDSYLGVPLLRTLRWTWRSCHPVYLSFFQLLLCFMTPLASSPERPPAVFVFLILLREWRRRRWQVCSCDIRLSQNSTSASTWLNLYGERGTRTHTCTDSHTHSSLTVGQSILEGSESWVGVSAHGNSLLTPCVLHDLWDVTWFAGFALRKELLWCESRNVLITGHPSPLIKAVGGTVLGVDGRGSLREKKLLLRWCHLFWSRHMREICLCWGEGRHNLRETETKIYTIKKKQHCNNEQWVFSLVLGLKSSQQSKTKQISVADLMYNLMKV